MIFRSLPSRKKTSEFLGMFLRFLVNKRGHHLLASIPSALALALLPCVRFFVLHSSPSNCPSFWAFSRPSRCGISYFQKSSFPLPGLGRYFFPAPWLPRQLLVAINRESPVYGSYRYRCRSHGVSGPFAISLQRQDFNFQFYPCRA